MIRVAWASIAFTLLVAVASGDESPHAPAVAEVPFHVEFPFLGEDLVVSRKATRMLEAQVRDALDNRSITGEIKEVAVGDAVRRIARQAGIANVWLDEEALREEGVAVDEPVSVRYKDDSPHHVLRRMLEPIALDYRIAEGVLRITTGVKVEEALTSRFYPIAKLRRAFGAQAAARRADPNRTLADVSTSGASPILDPHPDDARLLVDLIQNETSGPWQDFQGDGGTITLLGDLMLVNGTEKMHREVATLLRNFESLVESKPAGKAVAIHFTPSEHAKVIALRNGLARPAGRIAYDETPRNEVVARLSKIAEQTIVLDETALMEEGIALDEPITLDAEGLTVDGVLRRILHPEHLKTRLQNGAVVVTTEIKAEELLESVAFDVRDLIADLGTSEDALVSLVQAETTGTWQDIQGDGGTVGRYYDGILVIRQTQEVLEEVAELFVVLRETATRREGAKGSENAAAGRKRPDEAKSAVLVDRFYPLDRKGLAAQMAPALVELVAPESWVPAGGAGSVRRIDETLVIRQSLDVHRKIQRFLDDFKAAENRPAGTATIAAPRGF